MFGIDSRLFESVLVKCVHRVFPCFRVYACLFSVLEGLFRIFFQFALV